MSLLSALPKSPFRSGDLFGSSGPRWVLIRGWESDIHTTLVLHLPAPQSFSVLGFGLLQGSPGENVWSVLGAGVLVARYGCHGNTMAAATAAGSEVGSPWSLLLRPAGMPAGYDLPLPQGWEPRRLTLVPSILPGRLAW